MLALASHECSAPALAVIDEASLLTCQSECLQPGSLFGWSPAFASRVRLSAKETQVLRGRSGQVLTCAVVAFTVVARARASLCTCTHEHDQVVPVRVLFGFSFFSFFPSRSPLSLSPACSVYLDHRQLRILPVIKSCFPHR